MSFEIIYERKFIKCNSKIIPMCLYGSNNVTYINPATGREKGDRQWDTFLIGASTLPDTKILFEPAEILKAVNTSLAKCSDDEWLFKYRHKAMYVSDIKSFYENGIKKAVTIEEIVDQAHYSGIGTVIAFNKRTNSYNRFCQNRIATSNTLQQWANVAEYAAKLLKNDDNFRDIYIQFSFQTRNELHVIPHKNIATICVAKINNDEYLQDFECDKSEKRFGFTTCKDIKKAYIFQNSAELYATIKKYDLIFHDVKVTPIKYHTKRQSSPKHIAVSVNNDIEATRMVIQKLTPKKIFLTKNLKNVRMFRTSKEAEKWYTQHIEGKFKGLSDPKFVDISMYLEGNCKGLSNSKMVDISI